jgi:predicted RNase H-like HicB family nuclease
MRNEFTAVTERGGEWFVAWFPEIPGANGQERTLEECLPPRNIPQGLKSRSF